LLYSLLRLMIDVRQLTYFIAVVEAKSFTAAAEVLFIAQPALSQHLQRLEEEVGQQLLVRHSRGVDPTPAGLRLVEHARSILTMVETAKQDIRNFNEQPRGRVRLGMPRGLCDALALDLLMTWPRKHPNVTLQIVEQVSNALTESVQAGRLDMAVTSYPSEDRHNLIGESLLQEKMCAVLPKTEETNCGSEIRFADLSAEPLILCSHSNVTRQLIDMTAKYSSVSLNIAYEIDSSVLALQMVEAGLGTTIQPYLALRGYMKTGRANVRPIAGPSITRRLHLIRSRNRQLNLHEIEVIKALKDHLALQFANEPLIELELAAESAPPSAPN
jgi:LysR family transcriptional regulator, nitrogen assimilation regulatory protein